MFQEPHCEKCQKPISNETSDFLTNLFNTESWPARWHCGHWTDFHGWLYIISDIAIWAAYFTIPFLLIQFILKKKDVPFPKVFWLFGSFIFLCGTTHLIDAIIFYVPIYRVSAVVLFLTAVVSWSTIYALNKILPHAFSLKTPAELERVVEERTFELNQSINYSKFLADAMPQIVWTATPDGNLNYFNNQTLLYTGQDLNNLTGRNWLDVIHPDDRPANEEAWNHALNNERTFEFSHRIRRNDGVYKWHLTRATPQLDVDGNILMWVGTTTDIENQKEAENQKEQFMGIASHELKTPLTSLKAYLQLMNRHVSTTGCDEATNTYLEKANVYVERLNGLITDLLDISKLQAGKLQFNSDEFDLNVLVKDVTESMKLTTTQHQIEKKGIEEPVIVSADRVRIEQVLINYISNAIKYSPDADRIEVHVSVQDNHVVVSVKDYGIGIPPENLKRVFERFFRAEDTSTKFSGLGIGLYISSEIVKRHEGKVWVKSEEGKGSCFYFSIPKGS